jgi:hypothetical protein
MNPLYGIFLTGSGNALQPNWKEDGLMFIKNMVLNIATGLICTSALAGAEDRATSNEAEAMVKKAVAAYMTGGVKTFVDITAPSIKYVNKDLYIVVYDVNGKCVAHGQNAKLVGK